MRKEKKLIHVIESVDRALYKYDSSNVDVVHNEITDMLDIIYHSRNNSFPIEMNVACYTDVDIAALEGALNERSVGYCW